MLKHFVLGCFFTALLLSSFLNVAESDLHETFTEEYLERNFYLSNFSAEDRLHYKNLFDEILQRHRFRGNLLVKKNGEVLYTFSNGYKDYHQYEPLNEYTVFELASVSKQFTAVAIMLLAEEGKLDVDDPVQLHIPEFPYPLMTIRQMLNHTSGLANYMWYLENFWRNDLLPTNEDILNIFVQRNAGVNFSPGMRHSYNNTGYVFLALVVERISGMDFNEFLAENIFEPAGMRNTFTYRCERRIEEENIARGFIPARRYFRPVTERPMDGVLGDKGVFSNIYDMARFDEVLYNGLLLSDESLELAFSPATAGRANRSFDYGFGFRLDQVNGQQVVYHNGWWGGYKTSFKRYMDGHHNLVVLNNTNDNISSVIREIENVITNVSDLMYAQSE